MRVLPASMYARRKYIVKSGSARREVSSQSLGLLLQNDILSELPLWRYMSLLIPPEWSGLAPAEAEGKAKLQQIWEMRQENCRRIVGFYSDLQPKVWFQIPLARNT